jgi:nucleoside permease NupC
LLNLKKKADQDLDRFKVTVIVGAMLIGFVALMAAINNF